VTILETLPVTLTLGPVHLTISDLDRSVAWYERALGLRVRERSEGVAELGTSEATIVTLHEDRTAQPPGDHAGLFHYCLLYPTREDLARAALRIRETGTPITHQNDRHTHEAIYLDDPDGLNIELAWDRPRDQWPAEPYGHEPVELDYEGLMATIAGESMPPHISEGVVIGHVHLVCGNVADAIDFYHDKLGLDVMYRVYYGAFFSVGGYHHHAAANIKKGEGAPPQPDHVVGLRHWTIQLDDAGEVAAARERIEASGCAIEPVDGGFAVSDPSRIPVHVVS
jgi:catechol 2,3-dioxygenase